MSMDVGGAKGGVKADINVTPLVDVMLVLLIIMMLITPMLKQGVAMRLPEATNSVDKPTTQDNTVIAISKDGSVYLNAKPVAEAELATKINEALENKSEKSCSSRPTKRRRTAPSWRRWTSCARPASRTSA